MTTEEVIFCERSYMGETSCTECKYYGTDTCLSRESHRMAVNALQLLSSNEVIYRSDALKTLGERPLNWTDTPEEIALEQMWDDLYEKIQNLKSLEIK